MPPYCPPTRVATTAVVVPRGEGRWDGGTVVGGGLSLSGRIDDKVFAFIVVASTDVARRARDPLHRRRIIAPPRSG
jgi:hypothetical protein